MLENQGLFAIAFFQATALLILLVLLILFQKDQKSSYFRLWNIGWALLTLSSFLQLVSLSWSSPTAKLAVVVLRVAAYLVFLSSVVRYSAGPRRRQIALWPCSVVLMFGVIYAERQSAPSYGAIRWLTSIVLCLVCLAAGWLLWRAVRRDRGHGARLLAGVFLLTGLHAMDQPFWPQSPLFEFRIAFSQLLAVALGIAMVVLVLEAARARTEELNDKLRRLTLLTAASTQTLSVKEVLERVLKNLVESVGASHGIVRLLEGQGKAAQMIVRAAVGFEDSYLAAHQAIAASEPWVQGVLQKECSYHRLDEEKDPKEKERMSITGVQEIVALPLRGKEGPLGIVAVGSTNAAQFQPDEVAYLGNIANLLGMTLQNVRLFEQVDTIQRQWAYTFDSIGDPILVHDREFRILRVNQRLKHLVGKETSSVGRWVSDLLSAKNAGFKHCPYCEGVAGEGDDRDPWFPGYFLASNSTFTDPTGAELGTIHVLKDITERKRAEEKYRTLVSNVKEGVFISTPQGRFLDFNDAFLGISGYNSRDELLAVEIPALYVNPADRDRLKKLLSDHGSVADFEFDLRRKDGEVRIVMESSIAVRDAGGNVTAYQGFLLDITERKHAEQEIRRRNRELLVLNSIAQTLTESMDLSDSLHRTLRQIAELFSLDASSLYLLDERDETLSRIAAVGHRSEYARSFPPTKLQPELMQHLRSVHATFLSAQSIPLPQVFRDAQRKERIVTAYIVILWSKDRIMGGLVVGSRTPKEFSPADVNLLIAVGSQVASAIERSLLYEQTRQAYEDLRRTQEQLLHSEKMAAVGQLISGVAHELNNPLTAILGYSQLLSSNGQMSPQGLEYSEKLYKQAQRTHRIVQNLLSFARQHKPERVPVYLNQILEDTLALRDYDLRMSNIRVHLDLAEDIPVTAADPHQLQQVFLNLVNNAVDAILEQATEGDLWVATCVSGEKLVVEFKDSGPGVKDASRVFDPFYTTKPVGKGTGLGLSICYGIITEHGGAIRVKNDPPHGARFIIELPCQPASGIEAAGSKSRHLTAGGGRVLLVDQDESVLETTEAILRGRDHSVRTAKNLEQAQELLELHEFDVILLDKGTQGKNSLDELRTWLRAHRAHLSDRMIWMRAGAPEAASLEAGENHVLILQKPFKAADLLVAVDSVLNAAAASRPER